MSFLAVERSPTPLQPLTPSEEHWPTVTELALSPIHIYIKTSSSADSNFCKKHLLVRVLYGSLVPFSLITGALDTLIGMGVGTIALLTLGKNRQVVHYASAHLAASKHLLALPFAMLVQAINPHVTFPKAQHDNGLTTQPISVKLRKLARQCHRSHTPFIHHVASRLLYVVLAVSCLATRAIDGAIATPVVLVVLASGGAFSDLNKFAFKGLQAAGIISDLFACAIRCANPSIELRM